MSDRTKHENALAAALIEDGWSATAVADHLGISTGTLYQRGRRDPAFGAVLATVMRPRQVWSTTAEEQLVSLWFQPERYTVAQIAEELGITRQTVYRWANDLDLPMVRRQFRVRKGAKGPNEAKVVKTLARRLRIDDEGAARLLASFHLRAGAGDDPPR